MRLRSLRILLLAVLPSLTGAPVHAQPPQDPIEGFVPAEVHRFDIRRFGAVASKSTPEVAEANARAIQAAVDAAKADRDARFRAGGQLYSAQRGEVFIPGADFYVDRPIFHPGHVRLFGPPGTKGRLFGTRHMPILVLGPPTGPFKTHAEYGAATLSKHVDLSRLGLAPQAGRLWGYDLAGDRIYLRATGFDLPIHEGPALGLGAVFATKADYDGERLDLFRSGTNVAAYHDSDRLHLAITTADGYLRTFATPLTLAAGKTYRVAWEIDPSAGTVAAWVDGTSPLGGVILYTHDGILESSRWRHV